MRFDMIALQEVVSLLSITYSCMNPRTPLTPAALLYITYAYKPAYSSATKHCKPHVNTGSHESTACAVYVLQTETITAAHRHATPLLNASLLLTDCNAAH